jgi:hypothetical protein
MSKTVLTRREFLKTSASAAAAGALYLNAPQRLFAGERTSQKTRVVLVRHKNVLGEDYKVHPDVIAQMLDDAVMVLTDESNADAAWKTIAGPSDVVGIKSNVWSYIPTPPALEEAVERRLMGVGVEQGDISIDDRGVRRNKVFENASALINVRPVRTHHWSGVGTLIKNYIMFVDNPEEYHGDSCADLAKIWKMPEIEGKTRLNILVALTPLFHGIGPHHYNAKYVWAYNGLLVGFDPVAVDAAGVRILAAKRRQFFGEDRPINPPPKHVFLADTRHHLGTADPEKIDLIKLGWTEDILI